LGAPPQLLARDTGIMSNTDFLGRAIEVIKRAIENDTAGDYEKAYPLYYQARECFSQGITTAIVTRRPEHVY
jgi:hypothetical protein